MLRVLSIVFWATAITSSSEAPCAAQAAAVAPAVERVRKAANLPVAVGFGVKTPERAAEIARVADAVVAGSVFVDEVAAALAANEPAVPRVLAKVKALADAVKTARTSASVAETV